MKIRKLTLADAPRMLEWMKGDAEKYFRIDFSKSTLKTTEDFIRSSWEISDSCHLAVTDDNDSYMGTVSLKRIDMDNRSAEYAISLHPEARGQGYATFATDEVLTIAFDNLRLHRVYLNVLSDNERAIHFYRKYGFTYEGESRDALFLRGEYRSLQWFSILEDTKERTHEA